VKTYTLGKASSRLGYLADREYLLDRFSVADAYLVTVLNGTLAAPIVLGRLCSRPSVALQEEHADVTGHIGCRAPRTSARIEAGSSAKWSEMANADKRKQSLYFPEDMLKEIQHEAQRLDRSLSWIVQQGWKLARERLKAFPASNDDPDVLPDPREESV
jgi:uncharacterized small protein (TIGR04563 family)